MKKRILSVALALAMLVSVSTVFAAQPAIDAAPNNFYEGNKPFVTAEKILNELNTDKEAGIFDDAMHDTQFDAIENVLEGKSEADLISLLDESIEYLCPDDMSDHKKQYLVALVEAYDAPGNATIAEGLERHNTTDLSLRESFGLLDNYVEEMRVFFNQQGIDANDYDSIKEDAKKYVAEPLIAILKVMFAKDKTDMRNSYYNDFLRDDRAKKTLAVLFGAELTEEIVKDSFLSGVSNSNPNETIGIVHHVKKYLEEGHNAIRNFKNQVENRILVASGVDSVEAAFDVLGDLVVKAYQYDPNATDDLKADVKMLMGDGTTDGLIELMIKAVDNPQLDASNIWLNLFLSEFVQMNLANGPLNTVCADNPDQKVVISDNASVAFKNENLQDYGIDDGKMALMTGCFEVVCYVGTFEPTNITEHVTCSNGKIQITKDSTKGVEYDAFLVLYRKEANGVSTFIESYPVTVVNRSSSPSGGGTTRYAVNYETNGGDALSSEYYVKGATVQLTKVPVREGYIFTGWYLDAELTQKVDSIVMDKNITLYAGWNKDGSSVVSKVDVPQQLNGDEHFAYVIGYPEGDVRPQNNITRAEAVTILFRLLKDDVRNANVTDVNVFADVNEGDWYNKAVSTLASLGIVNGRTETEFMPNEYITRAEFATIFARFAEYSYTVTDEFKDIDGHWAENYINEAAAYGWIAGYEDNTFRPDNRITRAEAMTLINRVLKRNPENTSDLLSGMSAWTDNADTTAWYYLAVQEATNSHEYVMKNASYETWTKLTENRDWTVYEN